MGNENFKIEVPISVSGSSKGSDGTKVGEKIANQIKKSLGSIGIGKKGSGAGGAVAGGGAEAMMGMSTKALGWLAIIAAAVEGLSFILKPILDLFKVVLMLLFLPLIPILKPVMMALADLAKKLAPIMKGLMDKMDKVLSPTLSKIMGIIIDVIVANIDNFVNVIMAFLSIIEQFTPLLDVLLDGLAAVFTFFAENGAALLQVVLDVLLWAGDFLLEKWESIKKVLTWAADFLEPVWNTIRTILDYAAETILPKLENIILSIANILVDLYNAISNAVSKIPFTNMGGGTLGKIKPREQDYSNTGGVTLGYGGLQSQKPFSFNDFIQRPGQSPTNFSPQDTIIGVKNPSDLGGKSVTVNINNPSVRNDMDIKKIANDVSKVLQRQMSGRISQ